MAWSARASRRAGSCAWSGTCTATPMLAPDLHAAAVQRTAATAGPAGSAAFASASPRVAQHFQDTTNSSPASRAAMSVSRMPVSDAAAELAQQLVALFVAAGVVDLLEAIHVEEQHGAGPPQARRARHRFRQRLHQRAPVRQAGQHVAHQQLLQLGGARRHRFLQLRVHALERVAVARSLRTRPRRRFGQDLGFVKAADRGNRFRRRVRRRLGDVFDRAAQRSSGARTMRRASRAAARPARSPASSSATARGVRKRAAEAIAACSVWRTSTAQLQAGRARGCGRSGCSPSGRCGRRASVP